MTILHHSEQRLSNCRSVMISEATRQEADRKEAECSTSLQNNKRRLDEVYAKSNRLRHQLSHYQKLFPEETPDPGHHAAGKEPATAARPKTATRNKGQNKAPPEHPDKTWSETYRGASAGQKLKRKFDLFSRKKWNGHLP